MKTSELIGADLDYWTARAEGIPAQQLEIRYKDGSADIYCVHLSPPKSGWRDVQSLAYSTDWAQCGPLIERYKIGVVYNWNYEDPDWSADMNSHSDKTMLTQGGDTPLQAICRAVVRSVFGDEVIE